MSKQIRQINPDGEGFVDISSIVRGYYWEDPDGDANNFHFYTDNTKSTEITAFTENWLYLDNYSNKLYEYSWNALNEVSAHKDKVKDVKVNGTSLLDAYRNANIPVAGVNGASLGLAGAWGRGRGIKVEEGNLKLDVELLDVTDDVEQMTIVLKSDDNEFATLKLNEPDSTHAGIMSYGTYSKINSIDASAQTNVIEEVKVNGSALTVSGKSVNVQLKTINGNPINGTGNIEIQGGSIVSIIDSLDSDSTTDALSAHMGKVLDGKVALKEDTENKVTTLGSNRSDTQYPSAKAVWTELEKKVDKANGKGLSTNDFTDAYKADVENWINDPVILSTGDELNNWVLAEGNQLLGMYGTQPMFHKATSSNAGLMTSADKAKLDTIVASAQTNVIESIKVNGTALTITNKVAEAQFKTINGNPIVGTGNIAIGSAIETIKVDGTALTISNKSVNITGKENVSNKKSDGFTLSSASGDTTHYPSLKGIYGITTRSVNHTSDDNHLPTAKAVYDFVVSYVNSVFRTTTE